MNHGRLKDKEHHKSEQTIIPILVHEPQTHTENLKNEEWSDSVFFEQFLKCGQRNVKGIQFIALSSVLNSGFIGETRVFHQINTRRFNWIRQLFKDFLVFVKQKFLLLKDKKDLTLFRPIRL
jgi:hypothetical protein